MGNGALAKLIDDYKATCDVGSRLTSGDVADVTNIVTGTIARPLTAKEWVK